MAEDNSKGMELPRKLEKLIAALSFYYERNNRPQLQRLLVNSAYHVHEESSYDNWNGGTYGHGVYLQVPSAIYYEIFDSLDIISKDLCEGLNRLANVPNEHFDGVFLELQEDSTFENWRENSGLLIRNSPLQTPGSENDLKRIWDPGHLRLFLSHKSQHKEQIGSLKKQLAAFGISCFVAHEDIEPTKQWQSEIEKALFSMHALVPFLTDDFHNSHWTDQENGVAIGRGIPVIPIRLGTDPYGFIGKYQAVQGKEKKPSALASELAELTLSHHALREIASGALVTAFESAQNFQQAKTLMLLLDRHLVTATPETVERLKNAAKANPQVGKTFEVGERLPSLLSRLRAK